MTEAMTTESGEQAGPKGAIRQSPEGMSGGKQRKHLVSSVLHSCQEIQSPVLVTEGKGPKTTGPHGSCPRYFPTHAGMFFYFSC